MLLQGDEETQACAAAVHVSQSTGRQQAKLTPHASSSPSCQGETKRHSPSVKLLASELIMQADLQSLTTSIARVYLVPEPGVQQVQHSVLSAAHIQINRHPVFLCLSTQHAAGVGRVNEAQVVPAGACPLRHGACLPHSRPTCTS